jgi:alkanesulfonate monooxygenase SsuD/methylene tetrahydromethanopterin reductase-like flavin-dependent oxidoreductase (luciferase family)
VLAEIAREAEEAGWDGVFVWDALAVGSDDPALLPTCDPWVALAAIAERTERVKLGPIITPLARRRPWKVARETVTLDLLSNGRVILPVGLGALTDGGFSKVGEELDRRLRAERLDEALAILDGLWSGAPFAFEGRHFQMEEMTFLPKPVQQPRIPVWVVAVWNRPKSMRRALAWNGVMPVPMTPDGKHRAMTPDEVREMKVWMDTQRGSDALCDIVMEVETIVDPAQRREAIAVYQEVGATWWLEPVYEAIYTEAGGVDGMRAWISRGPLG